MAGVAAGDRRGRRVAGGAAPAAARGDPPAARRPGPAGRVAPGGLAGPHRAAWPTGPWRRSVTDPPYGIGYRTRSGRHDPIAHDESPEAATAELKAFLEAILPKLKPRAHLFVFCGWGSEAAFEAALEGAGLRVRSHAVWVKNNHGAGDLEALAPMHERILHATAGDAALYERHGDVFRYPKVPSERHPTEKPQPLLEKVISISTAPGDLVADPFGGVASTAAAARATGRAYWACELKEEYWAAGERRLAEPAAGETDP